MNLAKLEKNLGQIDLNQFKTEPIKLLIKQLYKYQKFSSKALLNKINRVNYTEATVKRYSNMMHKYLTTGYKDPTIADNIYNILDECVAIHAPILTPSEKEKRISRPRKVKLVQKVIKPVEPPKYIEKIPPQYAVKCENLIKLFSNKDIALGYIDCYKTIGDGKVVELVTVEFETVEELGE